MSPEKLKQLLEDLKADKVSVDDALGTLSTLPFTDIGIAKVDHHRAVRTGFPEVVLGERKDASQIAAIVEEMKKHGSNILVTRVDPEKAAAVVAAVVVVKEESSFHV